MLARKKLLRTCVVVATPLAVWTFLADRTAQALVIPLTFTELTQRSKLILTGEVVNMRSYEAPFQNAGDVFHTEVTIRVTKTLKGEAGGEEVKVLFLGGQIGDLWQKCPDAPKYKVGEKVLVFLREVKGGLWNTGWLQGKYTLDATGTKVQGSEDLPIPREMKLADVETSIQAVPPSTVEPSGGAR